MQQSAEITEEPLSKKKPVLILSDKLNILSKLDEGVTLRDIATQYHIACCAISNIKNKKIHYLSRPSNETSLQKKNLRMTLHPALEGMTDDWLCQKICLGEAINGPIVCRKACS